MKPLPVIPDPELQAGVKTDDDDDDVALAQAAEATSTLINDSLFPPLTADLLHRQRTIEDATSAICQRLRSTDARVSKMNQESSASVTPTLPVHTFFLPIAGGVVIYFSSPPLCVTKSQVSGLPPTPRHHCHLPQPPPHPTSSSPHRHRRTYSMSRSSTLAESPVMGEEGSQDSSYDAYRTEMRMGRVVKCH